MFEKVGFENIVKRKTTAGIELVLLPDGTHEINVVVLKKNKAQISIEQKEAGLNSIEELSKVIDANCPIVLLINGKGIIHRKITVSETDELLAILNKVLPNANIEEFTIQKTAINESEAFISVIRTNALNEIVEAFKKAKLLAITECFLGPFVVNNVLSLIDERIIADNNEFRFDKYIIKTDKGQLTDMSIVDASTTNEKILIGGRI